MPSEKEIEQEIKDKGLDAPRLTPEDIDKAILYPDYVVMPNGRTTVCELTLVNGFTVIGSSSCVSKENFDKKLGEKIAYNDARNKIWALEAYLLKQKLYENQ